jgi:RNA polymerase sigma factor (sigma-70 family)
MIAPKKDGEFCVCFIEPLVERAKQGDSMALDDLFSWLRPRINAILIHRTRRRRAASADVEDATQAACLRTLFRLAQLPSKDLLRHTALIARHALAKSNAKRGRRQVLLSKLSLEIVESLTATATSPEFDPARVAQEHEQAGRTIAALRELPPRDRVILWAVFVEDQSYRECSRLFGLSKTRVQRIVSEGRAHMARRLAADR